MRHLAILCAVGLVAAACSSATGSSAGTASATVTPSPRPASASLGLVTPTAAPTLSTAARIGMGDNFFTSNEVTVAVGATVVWQIDAGDSPHDVLSKDGVFSSISPMARGVPFSYTFTKPGVYAYVCTFHVTEGMIGKVIVK